MSLSRRKDPYTPLSTADVEAHIESSSAGSTSTSPPSALDVADAGSAPPSGGSSVPWIALVLALFVIVGVFFSLRAGHKTGAITSDPDGPKVAHPSVITHPDPSMRDVNRKYTLQELSRFNGKNFGLPILLSFRGDVYDVTAGARQYGKGGAYGFAAGRDVSRSFCLNCFQDACLLPDLRDMTADQTSQIEKWHAMFERTYPRVGLVDKTELVSTDAQLQAANERVEAIRKLHEG